MDIYKYFMMLLFGALCTTGCSEYLDMKPDMRMTVPNSLDDCRALLDDYNYMNSAYPAVGELAADNYYLTYDFWQSLQFLEERGAYVWNAETAALDYQWAGPYKVIYNANQVLETLKDIKTFESQRADEIMGEAYFFRAYAFFQLAQVFVPPYSEQHAGEGYGLPLKLSPAMDEVPGRSSVQQTYSQILNDFKYAALLLPIKMALPTRPSKSAAYAALARTYMAMGKYVEAANYADSCLLLKSDLLDYNELEIESVTPFKRFHREVIFHSICSGSGAFQSSICKIDSNLYNTYQSNDLRKELFFLDNGDGTYSFKGNYDELFNQAPFNGIAVDEVLLIRAECRAREGMLQGALDDLNTLLSARWKTGRFVPLNFTDQQRLMDAILLERRKELIFRNIRWSDLRRLNREPQYAVTLTRLLNDQQYTLPPNDLRYTMLIPTRVLQLSNLQQNQR